jgi:menaquinone-dependent protoporphyrinogen oxidase
MNWLIVFATNQDQSAKVAQRIARDLSSFGDEVDLYSAAALPMALGVAGYDAVIVGASAHAGPCRRAVRQFIDEHLVELGRMPSAFYSISLSEECSDPTNRPRSQAACDTLLEETGWQPDLVAVFAGPNPRARASSRLVQRVVRRGRQPDDVVSENAGYQYFDWHPVTTFARDCAMYAHHVHLTGAAGPACSAPR